MLESESLPPLLLLLLLLLLDDAEGESGSCRGLGRNSSCSLGSSLTCTDLSDQLVDIVLRAGLACSASDALHLMTLDLIMLALLMLPDPCVVCHGCLHMQDLTCRD